MSNYKEENTLAMGLILGFFVGLLINNIKFGLIAGLATSIFIIGKNK